MQKKVLGAISQKSRKTGKKKVLPSSSRTPVDYGEDYTRSFWKGAVMIIGVLVIIYCGALLALHFSQKNHNNFHFDPQHLLHKDGHHVPGEVLAGVLIEIIEHEMDGFAGWRPNDFILWGPRIWADNNSWRQIGIIDAVRETARVFKDNLTKVSSDAIDTNLGEADNAFRNDESKLWFPSAENRFSRGCKALKEYLEGLQTDPPHSRTLVLRNWDLIKLLEAYTDLLGDAQGLLYRIKEPDGGKIHTWRNDNYFYRSQGYAHVMTLVLQAIKYEYGDGLNPSVELLFHEVIEALENAATLKPLIVLDGSPSSLMANHRRNLHTYISEGRDKMFSIQAELEK